VKYAQRIQNALLGAEADMLRALSLDAFLLFKPKDIVSGDFYWQAETPNGCFVAVADCTGHGVPGSFMTILGISHLKRIVVDLMIAEPHAILHALDQAIIGSLRRADGGAVNDGMDMALVQIVDDKEIRFSGAKNPMYVYHHTDQTLDEYKGSKFPIGSQQFKAEKVFETSILTIAHGDRIFLCSDGFQDQFGGANSSKFMRKHFRDLLQSSSSQSDSMAAQKQLLNNAFEGWKGQNPQTDDVLVLGWRVKG
jgi:serine phosphatase RsbU (regulator of sigma subunit)